MSYSMRYTPGPRQREILEAIERDGWFLAETESLQRSCLKLHQRGYLVRDPQNSWRWNLTQKYAAQRLSEIRKQRRGNADLVLAALEALTLSGGNQP